MDDIDMELIWNEFGVQRLVMRRTAQVELEGTVPLPENIGAVSELIDYSASVTADACRTDEGRFRAGLSFRPPRSRRTKSPLRSPRNRNFQARRRRRRCARA